MSKFKKNFVKDSFLNAKHIHIGDKYFYHAEGLPPGILEYIEDRKENIPDKKLQYRSYLGENVQTYLSREAFKSQHPEATDFLTEEEILDLVLLGTPNIYYQGGIIYGEGGVGKTRLMLELGKRAKARGWTVFLVGKYVEKLNSLNQYLDKTKKYLLLFDYIEESESYNPDLHDVLNQINEDHLKIIANCRNTFRDSPNFPYKDKYLPVDLNVYHPWQKKYQDHVITSILGNIPGLDSKEKSFPLAKPSFAVFEHYLYKKEGDGYKNSDWVGLGDFRQWLLKRMRLTLGLENNQPIPKDVIQLFVCLPLMEEELTEFPEVFRHYLDRLRIDGWVDSAIGLPDRAIHDTIVDELLWYYIQNASFSRRVMNLLKFANERDRLVNCLRAFERILPLWGAYEQMELQKIFHRDPDFFKEVVEELAISPLFNEYQRMAFFKNGYKNLNEYLLGQAFAMPLCHAVNKLLKEEDEKVNLKDTEFLVEKWLAKNKNFANDLLPRAGASVLSTAIRLLGTERCKSYLKQYVKQPISEHASFVLVAWLSNNGPLDTLEEAPINYFKRYGIHKNAQYVYNIWMELGFPFEAIEPHFQSYLEEHAELTSTDLLLQNYLDSQADLPFLKPYLDRYLNKHINKNINCQYLLSKWWKGGGSTTESIPMVMRYLETFDHTERAFYLFIDWLKMAGESKVIEPFLLKYLDLHASTNHQRLLLESWLKAGGTVELIKPHLMAYLNLHLKLPDSRFPLVAWLNAQMEVNSMINYVESYLSLHQRKDIRSFLIDLWRSDWPKGLLINYTETFFEKYEPDENARVLLQEMIKRGMPTETLKTYLELYFRKFQARAKSLSIFLEWVNERDEVDWLSPYIIAFLKRHSGKKGSVYLLQKFLDRMEKFDSFAQAFFVQIRLIPEAALVFKKVIQSDFTKLETSYLLDFLAKHGQHYLAHNIFNAYITTIKEGGFLEPYVLNWLDKHVSKEDSKAAYLLQNWFEYIEPSDKIEKYFIGWLSHFGENYEAGHIMKHWVNAGGKVEVVCIYIKKWLERHSNTSLAAELKPFC